MDSFFIVPKFIAQKQGAFWLPVEIQILIIIDKRLFFDSQYYIEL